MIETLYQFFSDNLIFPIIAAVVVAFFALEFVSNLKNTRAKKISIIVISSVLILWLDYRSYFILLLVSTALLFLIKAKVNFRRFLYIVVIGSIALLIAIKDYGIFFRIENPYIPLGVSYYFFRLIAMIIEYNKNPKLLEKTTLVDYYTYIFFFPIFLAGPIQRIGDFFELKREDVEAGKVRFYGTLFISFLAKVIIVDALLFFGAYKYLLPRLVMAADAGGGFILISFVAFGILSFLHAYLDLMLYTEMSKSISRILGFSIQENFNRPLLASNISQFWQRWHMSLSNWTRDYVFFPALIKTRMTWLATYMSMLVIGIWHSATLNWIFWALAHATAINFYSVVRDSSVYKSLKKSSSGERFLRIGGNIVTVGFVAMIFIFVAIHDFSMVLKLYYMAILNVVGIV